MGVIFNKPTIPTTVAELSDSSNYITTNNTIQVNTVTLANVATSGEYSDLLNKPTIPAAQVQSDWNATSGMGVILNKPTLSTAATSGDYNDLTNKPTLSNVATSGDYNDLTNKPTWTYNSQTETLSLS